MLYIAMYLEKIGSHLYQTGFSKLVDFFNLNFCIPPLSETAELPSHLLGCNEDKFINVCAAIKSR